MSAATLASIAPAAPARAAGGAVRALPGAEYVLNIVARDRITVQRHDRIGEMLALIGLHPRFNGRASRKQVERTEGDQDQDEAHVSSLELSDHSRIRERMLLKYSSSSPGL